VKVLLHDDVGSSLGPELGNLDVGLLEDDCAIAAGDAGGTQLPPHQVEGVVLPVSEHSPYRNSLRVGAAGGGNGQQ
jgi:hypothetical protein